MIIIIFKAL